MQTQAETLAPPPQLSQHSPIQVDHGFPDSSADSALQTRAENLAPSLSQHTGSGTDSDDDALDSLELRRVVPVRYQVQVY